MIRVLPEAINKPIIPGHSISGINVTFKGRTIEIEGASIELEYRIHEAHRVSDDLVIVLFDPDADMRAPSGFRNLVGINRRGVVQWRAETPEAMNGDRYYRVHSLDPLTARSASSLFMSYRRGEWQNHFLSVHKVTLQTWMAL
ncbi:hypothetical protein CRI94_00010 [Longibacter salinarum]|uniref:Uncharacterized protein n=1 Tax=Longibacter salinarum TaxID=1850348 RepID=A0A2A8D183_9BACT|nr:hypothetical protein [Longibacter salinarum]PEN14719.1 hypothetical protein CRI94_00010 [Longibacter salinarum]